jgi:hypothetical protein
MPILGTIASSYRVSASTGFVALATTTLGSAANTVTFSSIPSGYKALEIRIAARGTSSRARIAVRFNGDTTSNYHNVYSQAAGSSVSAGSDYNASFAELSIIPDSTTNSSLYAGLSISILDYASTTKKKTIITQFAGAQANTTLYAGGNLCSWNNSAAISSIEFRGGFIGSGDFEAGSTFSIYGVA